MTILIKFENIKKRIPIKEGEFRCHSDVVNELFVEVIIRNTKSTSDNFDDERAAVAKRRNELNERISKARDMFLSDKIDEDDFRDIKNRYKGELDDLDYKLSVLTASQKKEGLEQKVFKALNAVTNISERYKNASTADKRAIVSLIYPEKIIFDGKHFQTPKINSFVDNILLIRRELVRKKKGSKF